MSVGFVRWSGKKAREITVKVANSSRRKHLASASDRSEYPSPFRAVCSPHSMRALRAITRGRRVFHLQRVANGFLIALVPGLFSGCAVYMAAKGTPEPFGGGPLAGQERNAVIAKLGAPKQSVESNGRRLETYEYKTGDAPSPWRAVVHGILDFASLGIWEVLGTPIEMAQGEKVRVTVEYDEDGRVATVMPGQGTEATARTAVAETADKNSVR